MLRSDPEVLLLVPLDRILNHFHRDVALLPSDDLDAPALEILVDMEEVLDFLQVMLREVRDVEVLVVKRIVATELR